jgi:predicted NACHT family NTPase
MRLMKNVQDEVTAILLIISSRSSSNAPPNQVRISCRAQDWLGDTDLAAFKPYFDRRGGAVVVALEPLSRQEMAAILADHGVGNPAEFLDQAYERDLEDFLLNPQNLLMLADVVKKGNWPKTRRELYHAATELLLQEHSPTRSRFGEGAYIADELRESAGSICAARLIADVEGISLRENDDRPEFPSYRTLPEVEKVRAALGRRAFRAGHAEETVDYSHRTTAEYLAAAWLADRVRAGFPIGRVRVDRG